MKSLYEPIIRREADRLGVEVDPRHVEAWMRLEWGVLDARPASDFRAYVEETLAIEEVEPGASESLARSYGL